MDSPIMGSFGVIFVVSMSKLLQTAELPVIWDDMMLMLWYHNEYYATESTLMNIPKSSIWIQLARKM